jgi:hypothetical protein
LFSVAATIDLQDYFKTVILAIVGAFVSFVVTVVLNGCGSGLWGLNGSGLDEMNTPSWRKLGGCCVFNVLALGEEADFEALNCLPAMNLIRSTKLHLSTEPPFLGRCC